MISYLNSYYTKDILTLRMPFFVGILGLEPRMTGPESVVLPLHHIPINAAYQRSTNYCKGTHFFENHHL